MSSVRVDKWLWAVRLFKTRSAANEACSSGRVRVGGTAAKPASRVAAGDEVSVRTRGVTRTYRIDRVIEKRVGAAIAAECYEDLTPPDALPSPHRGGDRVDAAWAERDRGAGRPTKRDRRQMEKFLGRPRD
ncbi:MAG: RNA-binding S4 domain-containing protein [Actinomycetota bacterium]